MKVTGLLLDLDNTLYDYYPCHQAGLQAYCSTWADLGLGSPHEAEQAYAMARSHTAAALKRRGASHHRLLYAQRAVETRCGASRPDLVLALADAYWEAYSRAMRPFDGVMEFLETARSRLIPVAIITDMVAEQQLKKLVRLGLVDDRITCVVSSEEVGIEKPSPRMFRKALSKLGLKPCRHVWTLGDSLERDVLPSLALGLSGAWVSVAQQHPATDPSLVCPPQVPIVHSFVLAWDTLDHYQEA